MQVKLHFITYSVVFFIKNIYFTVSITNTTIYRSCVAGVNTSSIIAFRWPNSRSYDGIEFAYSTDEKCPNGRIEGNALVKVNR